jgi:hypothetical protein
MIYSYRFAGSNDSHKIIKNLDIKSFRGQIFFQHFQLFDEKILHQKDLFQWNFLIT